MSRLSSLSVAMLVSLVPAMSIAQSNTEPTVVILGMQSPQNGARAVVYLKPDKKPEAVIAVHKGKVTEEDLAEAFAVLRRARRILREKNVRSLGDNAVAAVELTGNAPSRQLTPQERNAYRAYIKAFDRAKDVEVPHVGKGKGVEVKIGS